MNKRCFRVIFNSLRGHSMVVGELARTPGQSRSTTATAAPARWRCCAPLVLMLIWLGSPGEHATIVPDANAPTAQQPTVMTAPNGTSPVVNIQTPNAAGISHNSYSRFDVEQQGAILNNSHQAVHTHLSGNIAGNPHLTTGPAQVILNEVNSSNPSVLRGFVEVAGQRAQVVVANPSGIYVKGGGFINTSGVALTTGKPMFQNGHLDSYRVTGGIIKIEGEGLDTRTTDYTQIFARAVQLNAKVHAKKLSVTTGNNLIPAQEGKPQPIAGDSQSPAVALDVAKLGGMYAEHIFIVGTENGVGMRNNGILEATSGDLSIDNQGWLTNHGTLQSCGNLQVELNDIASIERTVNTTIVADPTAPKTQQPRISIAANKVPLVDIQTPNASGVSHNIYSRFDIERQGAILNNSRDAVDTRLAGTISGNANLTNGPARLILNEINSSDPSYLRGLIEVAGQGAQVVVANPSGVYVEGAGFINTSGATLITGRPQFQKGHLDSYRVTGGSVHINGKGLDTRGTDHTQIMTQAMQFNTKAQAEKLSITTGNNLIKATSGKINPISGNNNSSAFGLGVTKLGEIYAKQMSILGTQVGAEIRNDGILQTHAGDLTIANRGCLTNVGVLRSGGNLKVQAFGHNHTLSIQKSEVHSAGNMILEAESKVSLSDSTLNSGGSLHIDADKQLAPAWDCSNISTEQSQKNNTPILATPKELNNFGLLKAGGQLALRADFIRNHAKGVINATHTRVLTNKSHSGQLNNRGLIDGQTTEVRAHSLNNLGSGNIYGDQLLLGAHTLTNNREQVNANTKAIIAARQQLTIGAQHILNQKGALIMSAGPMAVGEHLDEQQQLVGQTLELNNHSATIDVHGDATFNITTLNNRDLHFSTQETQVSESYHRHYRRDDYASHILWVQWPHWNPGRCYSRNLSNGTFFQEPNDQDELNDHTLYEFTRRVTETQIARHDPAKLLVGGNVNFTGKELNNDKSQVIIGGSLVGPLKTITNNDAYGIRVTEDNGFYESYTYKSSWLSESESRCRSTHNACQKDPIPLKAVVEQRNTRPQGSGLQIPDRPEIALSQPSLISVATLNPRVEDNPLNTNNTGDTPTHNDLSTTRPIVLEQPSPPPDLEADLATISH